MAFLETKGLKKAFGGVTAVRDVDLEVEGNEIHSVIGPNGAGKDHFVQSYQRILSMRWRQSGLQRQRHNQAPA